MKTTARRLLAIGLLACASVLIAPVSWAGDSSISLRYAGTLSDKFADTDQDGFKVTLTQAVAKGTFGASTLSITAEFALTDPVELCVDDTLKFDLVFSAAVLTFSDLSQLYGFAAGSASYLCLNQGTGFYTGQVNGIYDGGVGRFETAGGTFTSDFGGRFIDLSIGYGSINGTVLGTVDW